MRGYSCSTLAGLFPIISPFSPHFMRGYSCSTLAGLFHDCANSQSDLDSNSCSTLAGLFPIISLFSPHFMRGYSCSTLFSVASPIGFQSICVHRIDFLNCQICMSQKNEGGATFPLCVRGYFAQRRVRHFLPDGRLVTPPDALEAQVYHDLIQVSCDPVPFSGGEISGIRYQKKGPCRLSDGAEIFPCQYGWIGVVDGKLLVYTTDRLTLLTITKIYILSDW